MTTVALIVVLVVFVLVVAAAAVVAWRSVYRIGPTEVGLVNRRLSVRRLADEQPVAFRGEAGYQARLLMPGFRFMLWPMFEVTRFPWVQVPAGQIGVVIAQVGSPPPIGAKSARYRREFGNFTDVGAFLAHGGEKGVQRPVLPPGTLAPIHPAAFIVVTADEVFGLPLAPELADAAAEGELTCRAFALAPHQLRVTVITPDGDGDVIGLVTALEGGPLPSGDIASRLGGFDDLATLETKPEISDAELADALLGSKNDCHNNYQDFQAFLDAGGRIGLQHDPILYGAYLLNPFLVRVDLVPMLVVDQGEVAVIKAFVGQPSRDTSGAEFKFGSIVRPGHRGIWQEPLRTGKYAINPRIYSSEIVPTSVFTLHWANPRSAPTGRDARLEPIIGKTREGFAFTIELQVQIHVSDTRAPELISMVGTMSNLVNGVLQSAVGNHFRNTLQQLEAVRFIETRDQVQQAATKAVAKHLEAYGIETRGVYIQDVEFPADLVEVLTQREIALQARATFEEQQRAQTARIDMEKAKGAADMQSQLAAALVAMANSVAEGKLELVPDALSADGTTSLEALAGALLGALRTAEVRAPATVEIPVETTAT
jgi:uncharacterized membrane protein YqiK